jgi:hypothetical protein
MRQTVSPGLGTSFRPRSTVEALQELPHLEAQVSRALKRPVFVGHVDLYCFGERDPALLLPDRDASGYVGAWLAGLTPGEVSAVGARLRELLVVDGTTRRQVAALSSYLPAISAPSGADGQPVESRLRSVAAVRNLVKLAREVGASCVEIVAGANFVRVGEHVGDCEVRAGSKYSFLCRQALCASLQELADWMAKETTGWAPPVGLALELEPGLSYGLNSGREALLLFEELDRVSQGAAAHVALNLDIGHAWLLSRREPELRALLWDRLSNRIAHAHISRHVAAAHFADQPLTERERHELGRWLDLFITSQTGAAPAFATGVIAVEQEAANPPVSAVESFAELEHWLAARAMP